MADDPDISPLAGQIAVQYPALAKIMENISLGYGPKDAYGFMEAYPPWEQMNPTPGRYNISVFNRDVKGQDLRDMIAADALHFLGARDPKTGEDIDPVWRGFREQFWRSLTPDQQRMNREAFHRDTVAGRAGEGGFESWMDRSRLDAYLRGGLFPQVNPEWRRPGIFSDQQQAMLKNMSRYLQAFTAEPPSLDELKQALANYSAKAGGEEATGPADELLGNLTPNRRTREEIKNQEIDPGIQRYPAYEPGAKPDPQVQPYPGLRTPSLQQAAFRVPSPLRGIPGMNQQIVPGTRDENLLQPGEEGAVVGSRPVPGTRDTQPRFNGPAPYNLPGAEDDRVQQAGTLHEIRPEMPPLPTLFPRAWTSPLPYDLTYPGMDPKMRQPPAVKPKPANEAALRGSPLLQQAAFQMPGLQTPQASASPLLQYIGKLLGFGQDQTGEADVPGFPPGFLRHLPGFLPPGKVDMFNPTPLVRPGRFWGWHPRTPANENED